MDSLERMRGLSRRELKESMKVSERMTSKEKQDTDSVEVGSKRDGKKGSGKERREDEAYSREGVEQGE